MTIAELVVAARGGDREAFGHLVRRFQNAGYAIALSHVSSPDDAEDVLQDACITAYLRLGQLREAEAFAGWFRSIVVSQSQMWLRSRGSEQRYMAYGEHVSSTVTGGDEPSARLARYRVWDRVRDLREPYRSAALLHYFSGFSHAEIAAFLQVPLSTVNGRLQQSRIRLRQTLDSNDLMEIEMGKVDVAEEVEETLYQVASEPIDEIIDVPEEHPVVLLCGYNTDVRVEASASDALTIKGSRVSMGLSPEAAQQSARAMQVRIDQVSGFAESGPHEGEMFIGSDHVDGKPQTRSCTTRQYWDACRAGQGGEVGDLHPEGVFPNAQDRLRLDLGDVAALSKDAVRVSLVQEEVQSLVLPRDAYRPVFDKVFRPNSTSDRWLHGPLGYSAISVAVPHGTPLVVVRADEVVVIDVIGSVDLIHCTSARADGIAGDLGLYETPAQSVRKVGGRVTQRWFSFGGMEWADHGVARRNDQFRSHIENVQGGLDIDVGRAELEIEGCAGDIRVANRHGSVRVTQTSSAGGQVHIETVSGPVRVRVPKDVSDGLRYAILTLCGTIECAGFPDLSEKEKGVANSTQLAALSSIPSTGGNWSDALNADLLVKTECGDVVLEELPDR